MRYYQAILTVLPVALLSACATPQHSNTLIFATNTAVVLDVSASPTSGEPHITIGYKRQEGAWVPLLANAAGTNDERPPAPCPTTISKEDCVFRGTKGSDSDAFSVLATFSGDVSAKGSTTAEASGSIAQFFATGMAARELVASGGAQLEHF